MKGNAIISGKFLTLPLIAVLLILTTACFTIVAGTEQPEENASSSSRGSGGADSAAPSLGSPDRDNDNAYQLELIAEPRQAADFVVNPKANARGAYLAGTAVTIDVLRRPGWAIEQWVGPVYAVSGDIAKVDMDQDQTVVVRMVQAGQIPVPPITPRPTPTNTPQLIPAFALNVNRIQVSNSFIELDNGTVEISPEPNGPRNLYVAGTTVKLRPIAENGFKFRGWEGDCAGSGEVCSLDGE